MSDSDVQQPAVNEGKINDGPQLEATAQGRPIMQLKVYSPFQTYFDEPAFSISAKNNTGPFDILPRHHNFITLVDACELTIHAPLGERQIRISGGIMHVKADQVSVFLDV